MVNPKAEIVVNDPKPVRILLVEDNAGDVYLFEKALKNRRLNYELTRYADGEQVIRALQKDDCATPDLIILDLNLPRRGGFDVLQTIRSKPSMVGIPVGILTSSDAAKDRHRIAVTGGERYIHKPPELEDFLEQVGRAIEECQRKVEMSYSLQSRNVRFWPGGVRVRGSVGVPVKRRRAMLASNPIKE